MVEAIALISIVLVKPFESNRLNVLMVYLLGFSKVATVALASAFDARFNLPRITTTAIGIVIIVIQGAVTIVLMILILLGAISSYMSLSRNREEFKPRSWLQYRTRYFAHVNQKATDQPAPLPIAPEAAATVPTTPTEPYFKVASVRREPKIEDEDGDDQLEGEEESDIAPAPLADAYDRPFSRTQSIRSRASVSNLPYGARRHRASWSSRDFSQMYDEGPQLNTPPRMSVDSQRDAPARQGVTLQRLPSLTAGAPALQKPDSHDAESDERHSRNSHRDSKRGSANVNKEQLEA